MKRLLLALVGALGLVALLAPAATAAPSGPTSLTVQFDCTHYGPFFTAVIPNPRNLLSDWVVTSPVITEEVIDGQIQPVQSVAHVFHPTGFALHDLTTGQIVFFGRQGPSSLGCEAVGLNTSTGTFVGPGGDTYAAYFFSSGVFGTLR